MEHDRLTIRISGLGELPHDVRLDDLNSVCESAHKALQQLERSILRRKPTRSYYIDKLKEGSVIITVREFDWNDPHFPQPIIQLLTSLVSDLRNGNEIDSRIDWMTLEHLKRLARPVVRGTASAVEVAGISLGKWFVRAIDDILSTGEESIGSVSGRLDKLNVHSGHQFQIYPGIGTTYIRCQFGSELLDQVRKAVKRNVTVYGMLHTMRGRLMPMAADVHRLEIHPDDNELPTLKSLRGIGAAFRSPKGAVATIRAIRDAQET